MSLDPLKKLRLDRSYKILIVFGFFLLFIAIIPRQEDIIPAWKLFAMGIITILLGVLLWQNSEYIQSCNNFNNTPYIHFSSHYNIKNIIQQSNIIKLALWLIYFLSIGIILGYGHFASWFHTIEKLILRLPHYNGKP
jgi:hypothetical protein